MAQFNLWEPQDEAWISAEIHRLVDHFQADHRTYSKLASLYELAKAGAERFSNSVERIPADRRAGGYSLRETNNKQSGTSQGR